MGEAEGTSPSLLFLVGAAAGCCCPRDRQSYLCRPEWRCHNPLAVSLLCTLSGWGVLGCAAAPAAADWKEKSWGRTAVSMQHVNTLHIKSHRGGQARYLQLQSSGLGRGILAGMGSWIWAPHFWCGCASVSCALGLALSTVKPRPQKVNGAANSVIDAWWWYWWCEGKLSGLCKLLSQEWSNQWRRLYLL